ncbi:hypothetical protein P154DRAFT_451091, partial [Amniculicola lignicola CBS 123094]
VRVVICRGCFSISYSLRPLEQGVTEGENPIYSQQLLPCKAPSTSRVVWECSSKWEVNFF